MSKTVTFTGGLDKGSFISEKSGVLLNLVVLLFSGVLLYFVHPACPLHRPLFTLPLSKTTLFGKTVKQWFLTDPVFGRQ